MRLIGTLSTEDQARVLADHLLSLGITTRLLPEREGWGVWVHNEDRLAQARQELDTFRQNPDDPRFQDAGTKAEDVRRGEVERDRQFRKNYRPVGSAWSGTNFKGRPVTVTVAAACIAVFLLMNSGEQGATWVRQHLLFGSTLEEIRVGAARPDGLDPLRRGEFWRLITPIFIHYGGMHILFNLWMWISVASVVEYRRGSVVLASLLLLSALGSNAGQYVFDVWRFTIPIPFGGLSGVDYALFGYVWMKGRFDPAAGMALHPSSVRWMLGWLVLCFTGIMGPIANAAHVGGLVVGVLFGLGRF